MPCFWNQTFHFETNDALAYPSLLADDNMNLTAAQKELLLWHHKLSHVSTAWIQRLMRNKDWLADNDDPTSSLHTGPFLPCKSKRPVSEVSNLKCPACVCAKAHRRPTQTRISSKTTTANEMILKRDHIIPGDCISADHYLSPVAGRLYNTYGRERQGYSCGTLFVDHASGKLFNFPQLSTSANDTVASKHCLE